MNYPTQQEIERAMNALNKAPKSFELRSADEKLRLEIATLMAAYAASDM